MQKKYYFQSCIGAACFFVFTVTGSISVFYGVISTLYLSYLFAGFFSRIGLISLIDSLMQHTYPKNVLMVSVWMALLQNLIALVIIRLGRVILLHVSDLGILSFVCSVKLVGVLFCVVSKPKTLRLSAENTRDEEYRSEEIPLVQK